MFYIRFLGGLIYVFFWGELTSLHSVNIRPKSKLHPHQNFLDPPLKFKANVLRVQTFQAYQIYRQHL